MVTQYIYSAPTPLNPKGNKDDWVWIVALVCTFSLICVVFKMVCIWRNKKSKMFNHCKGDVEPSCTFEAKRKAFLELTCFCINCF